MELESSRPGKPTDSANMESPNDRQRRKCLNATWFRLLKALGARSKHRGSTTTRAAPSVRTVPSRRVGKPLQRARCNGDLREARTLYFRAVLNTAQGHSQPSTLTRF
ncbi:hypothetical protein [Hydrogenophaga palleronii]|uniref:hypothetical protein n=1 Tax=Hydrogenophaga palleronii TaxID=65655 RepID=UPI0009FEA269